MFAGKVATFLQYANGIVFAEMVQGKRTKNDVVPLRRIPFKQVGGEEFNLREIGAEAARNFDGGTLLVDGVDANGNILSSCKIDDQAWDVARPGGDIQDSRFAVRLQPAR